MAAAALQILPGGVDVAAAVLVVLGQDEGLAVAAPEFDSKGVVAVFVFTKCKFIVERGHKAAAAQTHVRLPDLGGPVISRVRDIAPQDELRGGTFRSAVVQPDLGGAVPGLAGEGQDQPAAAVGALGTAARVVHAGVAVGDGEPVVLREQSFTRGAQQIARGDLAVRFSAVLGGLLRHPVDQGMAGDGLIGRQTGDGDGIGVAPAGGDRQVLQRGKFPPGQVSRRRAGLVGLANQDELVQQGHDLILVQRIGGAPLHLQGEGEVLGAGVVPHFVLRHFQDVARKLRGRDGPVDLICCCGISVGVLLRGQQRVRQMDGKTVSCRLDGPALEAQPFQRGLVQGAGLHRGAVRPCDGVGDGRIEAGAVGAVVVVPVDRLGATGQIPLGVRGLGLRRGKGDECGQVLAIGQGDGAIAAAAGAEEGVVIHREGGAGEAEPAGHAHGLGKGLDDGIHDLGRRVAGVIGAVVQRQGEGQGLSLRRCDGELCVRARAVFIQYDLHRLFSGFGQADAVRQGQGESIGSLSLRRILEGKGEGEISQRLGVLRQRQGVGLRADGVFLHQNACGSLRLEGEGRGVDVDVQRRAGFILHGQARDVLLFHIDHVGVFAAQREGELLCDLLSLSTQFNAEGPGPGVIQEKAGLHGLRPGLVCGVFPGGHFGSLFGWFGTGFRGRICGLAGELAAGFIAFTDIFTVGRIAAGFSGALAAAIIAGAGLVTGPAIGLIVSITVWVAIRFAAGDNGSLRVFGLSGSVLVSGVRVFDGLSGNFGLLNRLVSGRRLLFRRRFREIRIIGRVQRDTVHKTLCRQGVLLRLRQLDIDHGGGDIITAQFRGQFHGAGAAFGHRPRLPCHQNIRTRREGGERQQ